MSSRSTVSFFRNAFSTSIQPVGNRRPRCFCMAVARLGAPTPKAIIRSFLSMTKQVVLGLMRGANLDEYFLICCSVSSTVPYSGA